MAGDISAYIPTNVISITDGQIFLESELFHAGMRPAVNVGLSVSRVGRSAQRAAMRKVTGTLRLDLAQFREMSVFLQFGADIDSATRAMLEDGVRKNELLKQPKHEPYSLLQEVYLLLAAEKGLYSKVPVAQVGALSRYLLEQIAERGPTLYAPSQIERNNDFDEGAKSELLAVMEHVADEFAAKLKQ
jgi:F-type H+-transporting ATPase subunit alpha